MKYQAKKEAKEAIPFGVEGGWGPNFVN
jgi:hypothetical protein